MSGDVGFSASEGLKELLNLPLRAIHNSKFHVVTFEDYNKYYRLTIPGIVNVIQSDAMSGGNVSAAPCK